MSDRYIGSNFDDFLVEEGLFPEVEATATKRVLIYQLQQAMDRVGISKIEMAQKMNVTQAVVDNLLDPNDSSVNLQAIEQATSALGENLTVNLYPIQLMNPADILILEAFLFAVSQQTQELPSDIEITINEIARSLETRIMDLHYLAIANPTLEQPYREGRNQLFAISSERTKGPPNYNPQANRTNEIANATPEIKEADIAANRTLDRIGKEYQQGRELLTQPNFVDKIRKWLNTD